LLIVLTPLSGFSSSIAAPGNLRAQVLGTVLGVTYNTEQSRLEADCLEGSCLVANARDALQLSGGQSSWASATGIGSAGDARYDPWAGLAGRDPAWITPTPLPSATPTATPTRTQRYIPVNTTEAPPPGPNPTATPELSPTEQPTIEQPTDVPTTAPPATEASTSG
jgi:hypothetical protein